MEEEEEEEAYEVREEIQEEGEEEEEDFPRPEGSLELGCASGAPGQRRRIQSPTVPKASLLRTNRAPMQPSPTAFRPHGGMPGSLYIYILSGPIGPDSDWSPPPRRR